MAQIRRATPEEEALAYVMAALEMVASPEADAVETAIQDVQGQEVYAVDHYISGGPGYTGRVLLIHWDGSPDYVSVITEYDDAYRITSHNDGEPLCSRWGRGHVDALVTRYSVEVALS